MDSSSHPLESIRHIPLTYDNADSRGSALNLVFALRPEWEQSQDQIKFVRFTDGITNTLLKAVNQQPGWSEEQRDHEAILIRAYGKGSDVLIDRERECRSHSLLARQGLAPPLLARFDNGLMYKFIPGSVTKPEDLRRPEIWRGVASRLAEWHATLPISAISTEPKPTGKHERTVSMEAIDKLTPGKPIPNVWTVMQKWILALPNKTQAEKDRRVQLQNELEWIVKEFGDTQGIGAKPLVFSHCDLLSGNVIVEPHSSAASDRSSQSSNSSDSPATVSFIDYEYATPAPAAFDIANHFAEWGGFDCDFGVLPTKSQRIDFLTAYLESYSRHLDREPKDTDLSRLFDEIDRFRGIPGIYWGVWALIQAMISQIDFNYAEYAEIRFSEYWAWKAELDGSRKASGNEMPLRERRWAQEK